MEEDTYPIIRTNLAMMLLRSPYYNAQNVIAARSIVQSVVERYPYYAEAWATLGITKSALRDGKEAMKCWQQALELRPNYAEVYGDIGTDYAYEGQWSEAIEYYCKGLEIRPDVPVLWINLSIAYARTGQTNEAEAAYQQAKGLDPIHPQLWRCPFNLRRRVEAAKLRLESTRLRIELIETTPAELLEEIPDQQFLELW